MVIEGGFRIELVDANSKIPYKEHTKDGKTYAEVEPDAEYFVSLQKIAVLPEDHYIVDLLVENQTLGWYVPLSGPEIDDAPMEFGLLQRVNGVTSSRALKFVKPQIAVIDKITDNSKTTQQPALFGTVMVKLYKASSKCFKKQLKRNFSASLLPTADNLAAPVPGVASKHLRSEEGAAIGPAIGAIGYSYSYRKCKGLVSIVHLHYCSALGLMQVGVLPKPDDRYAYHRMLTGKKRARAKIPIVTHKRIRRASILTVDGTQLSHNEEYNDLFEIPSDDDSDDEDADGDGDS
jgi:hypothetical protein